MITVVTCDIVGSSKYPSALRAQMQEHLLKSWERVKLKYSGKLDSDLGLRITAGDEFQFICKDIETALDCVTFLRILCRLLAIKPPFTFRASLGIGERSVQGDNNPYTSDGPAFHAARDGMEELKKGAHLTAIRLQSTSPHERVINGLLPLADVVYEGWSQADVRVLEFAFDGRSGVDIAHELGISRSAVSQTLDRTRFSDYMEHFQALTGLLSETC